VTAVLIEDGRQSRRVLALSTLLIARTAVPAYLQLP
jgi:hypothetical protein